MPDDHLLALVKTRALRLVEAHHQAVAEKRYIDAALLEARLNELEHILLLLSTYPDNEIQ